MFFEKMQNRKNDGFTLVELIVVIAILAILAGIGVPAYSGYVEKANMAADQQLVSEVANALTLQYYAGYETGKLEGTSAIVLTKGGKASVAGDAVFATNAMNAAFGIGWEDDDALSLKHSWGAGTAKTKDILAHFDSVVTAGNDELSKIYGGTYVPSFANDVDDLFVLVKDTAMNFSEVSGSGAALIQGASDKTVNNVQSVGSSDFADLWSTQVWDSSFLMGEGVVYDGNASKYADDMLQGAIANAAVIKARNTSLACYLRDNGFEETYDFIADYNYKGSVVPQDIAAALFGGGDDELAGKVYGAIPDEEEEKFAHVLYNYFGQDFNEEGDIVNLEGTSQAYKDGLAYFAMMDTIDQVKDENPVSDDTYWDEMAGAVNLYGAIARGEADVAELNQMYSNLTNVGNDSVIVLIMAQNEKMNVNVTPLAAKAGN